MDDYERGVAAGMELERIVAINWFRRNGKAAGEELDRAEHWKVGDHMPYINATALTFVEANGHVAELRLGHDRWVCRDCGAQSRILPTNCTPGN